VFYGWVIVAGTFVSHLLSYGVLTVAFGIFFPFMADALHLGRGLLATTAAVARLMSAALSPLIGPMVDRRGARPVMTLGVLSLAAGAVVLGVAGSAWHVMLGYGVVMAFGSTALGELTGDATVARWFVRRRGRALAIATMGLSTAGIVVPLPLAILIAQLGWRSAWLVLAGVVLVLGLAAAALMRRRPEDYGLVPDGTTIPSGVRPVDAAVMERSVGMRAAARMPSFWLLVLSTNLAGLGFFGVNLHLFSYITDRGLPAAAAASIITYLYTLHTVAKPLWGFVAERVHVRYCIAVCYAGGALGVVMLLGSASVARLIAFATVYGLTRGAQSFVTSLAWADYFGREAQGAIRGLASPFRHLAAAAGPIVGGVLYDLSGDYRLAFIIFAAAFASGAAVALAAKPPP
jgi:OFA family oxalate/formate antiporter-like MFS transporter